MANDSYNTKKRIEATKKQVKAEQDLKELQIKYDNLQHSYNALRDMNNQQDKVIKDYIKRDEKECYYAIMQGNNVLRLDYLQAYHTYLPYQAIEGYDMDWIIAQMETPLYQRFPFVKTNDRQLEIDETKLKQYKAIKGGLI